VLHVEEDAYISPYHRCKKRANKNFKNVKKLKNVTKIKKTFVNVIKTLPLLSVVQLSPDAQEMAFEATRNIPFSLVFT